MGHKKSPGTHERGGVCSTMNDAMHVKASPGKGNHMDGPFGKYPPAGGGIPTTMYARGITAPAVPAPSQTAPSQQGNLRPGTKQYSQGGKTKDGR